MVRRGDAEYKQIAEALYQANLERLKHVATLQADYGKWLAATITAVHSAALYAIATNASSPLRSLPFAVGLGLILLSGLSTWANWSIAIRLYEGWTNPVMLLDDAHWPEVKPFFQWSLPLTMWLALISGTASALCIFWGASPAIVR